MARCIAVEPETDRDVRDLLTAGRTGIEAPLDRRERLGELAVGGSMLIAGTAMALLLDAQRGWETLPAVVLVLAFAFATRIQLDVGAGYTVPTQLVFVPMLLLLPTPLVPLLVAAGWAVGRLPDVVEERAHPERLLVSAGNSWFAVGPAMVLVALDAQTPDWGDWPAYLLALAAQVLCDAGSAAVREAIGRGVRPRFLLGLLQWVYAIDVLLSGPALLAAFASREARYAFLGVLPGVLLFGFFARERAHRLADAIVLAERSEDAAGLAERLLASEREATRIREEVLAGASAEVLTPVGRLNALVYRLRRDGGDAAARAAHLAEMEREVQLLRHNAGQFIDYSRLKAGRALPVEPRRTELARLMRGAATAFGPGAAIIVDCPGDLPDVRADEGRVLQMLMILLSNAVKYSPPHAPVRVAAAPCEDGVELSVRDAGPGIPEHDRGRIFDELRRGSTAHGTEGAGIGLYLCRILADASGAELRVDSSPGRGSTFTIRLPRADRTAG